MRPSKARFAYRIAPLVVIAVAVALAGARYPHRSARRTTVAAPRDGGDGDGSRQVRSRDAFVPEVPERLKVDDEVRTAVERMLGSLTKEDFARREEIVAALADADLETAAGLAAVAQDETSPLRLGARYVIRRAFDRVGLRVLEQAVDAEEPLKTRGEQVFLALADVPPLDEHHHGDWQKRGIFYEKFGYPAKAAEAYRRWVPPGSFCGTCAAAIAGERIAGMVRCLQHSNQYDEALQLVLGHPSLPLLLRLVEIYHAQGKLDQVAEDLRNVPGVSADDYAAVKEYVAIRTDLEARRWDRLIPYLYNGFTRRPRQVYNVLFDLQRPETADHWKMRVVAEGLAQVPEETGPLLVEQLRLAEAREAKRLSGQISQGADPSAVAGIFYALLLVKTPEAAAAVRGGGYLNWPSAESDPIVRDFLAVRADDRTRALVGRLAGDSRPFNALAALVDMGVDEAIEPLIQYLDDPSRATWALLALWRRTGTTLGADRVLAEYEQRRVDLLAATPGARFLRLDQETEAATVLRKARDRWLAWWQFEGATLEPKPPAWWHTPEAAPLLLDALESPSRVIQGAALRELKVLEHPVLADLTDQLDIAKLWLRYDPPACIPTLIEYADTPTIDVRIALSRVTRQSFGTDKAAWQQWWQREGRQLEFPVDDRWW